MIYYVSVILRQLKVTHSLLYMCRILCFHVIYEDVFKKVYKLCGIIKVHSRVYILPKKIFLWKGLAFVIEVETKILSFKIIWIIYLHIIVNILF